MSYAAFLDRKRITDPMTGLADVPSLPGFMFPHQRDIASWALRRGRAAVFAGTGLGKTLIELVWSEAVAAHTGKPVLIFAPLAVASQHIREAGGWTRETLEGWGVAWPPQKGWKDKLIGGAPSYPILPKPWVGRVRAISKTELAIWYWETDTAIKEIIEAYAPGRHTNEIGTLAGRAVLLDGNGKHIRCRDCTFTVTVTSRSEATARVRSEMRRDHSGFTCERCIRTAREAQNRQSLAGIHARSQRAKDLATMPYRDYLQTPEWQETRQAALRRAHFQCQTCAGGGTLHVHHRTYVRRGNEWASDLIVLCAGCHELFHQNARLAEGGRAETPIRRLSEARAA